MAAALPEVLGTTADLLEAALAQSFNAVLITDADLGPDGCRIVYCNPAFCRMTGYTAAELIGRTPRLLQGPETDAATLGRLRASLQAGQPFQAAAVNYANGGRPYHVEWHISPLRDAGGAITHFLSIQQDVTALKQAEQRRDLLAAALDIAPSAIFITNRSGEIVFANRALEPLTGHAPGEVLGRTTAELGLGAQDSLPCEDGGPLPGRPLSRGVFSSLRRDGSRFFCTQSFTALTDPASGEIRNYITVAFDISDLVDQQRRLQNQANRDALTGVLNRGAGEDVLRACERAQQFGAAPYALVLVDIDHFKRINDGWGHAVGDRVLRAFALRLVASVRSADAVVRWGGEEFLVVLPGVGLEGALELAQRIRSGVEAMVDAEVGPITVSMGVAACSRVPETAATVFEKADRALYAAKSQGRDRIVVADDGSA